jgi:hypothetical protein
MSLRKDSRRAFLHEYFSPITTAIRRVIGLQGIVLQGLESIYEKIAITQAARRAPSIQSVNGTCGRVRETVPTHGHNSSLCRDEGLSRLDKRWIASLKRRPRARRHFARTG